MSSDKAKARQETNAGMYLVALGATTAEPVNNFGRESSLDATTPQLPDLSPLALHVGLQIIGKGGKFYDGVGTTTSSLTYLEVPIRVVYRYQLPSTKGKLFGGFGPYLDFGVGGKIKY